MSYAATYYVRNGGNDAAAGTSESTAWATITKVNNAWSDGTIVAGDNILFRKGDIWHGTITVSRAGSSDNPITIGSYGTGEKPIITGFTDIGSWTVHSGSVYRTTVSSPENQTNMVVIDGQPVGMGRYPDNTWLSYTAATSTTIYDATLPDSPNWTGAEVVINKEYWITERCNITGHSSGTLTYTGGIYGSTSNNRRYFIQNDLRCVTTDTEWYHDVDAGRLYMYGNQSGRDVKIATLNRLIYSNYAHIHIVGLKLVGSISHAVHLGYSATYNRVEDCDIIYAGDSGIEVSTSNFVIQHNDISHSNYGIRIYTGNNGLIAHNNIEYIGMIRGAVNLPHASGIYINGTDNTVEYNRIQYTDWSGISTSSISTYLIRRNFINYACMLVDDGGGIYSTSSRGDCVITENIVLNSGVGSEDWLVITRGIYYDAGGSGAVITNNIVSGCEKGAGLLIHYGDNHLITGNVLFDNQRQAEFLKYQDGVSTGLTFNNNILIAKETNQLSLRSLHYTAPEIQNWGTFDYNYYARPIKDDDHFYYTSAYHTLSDWKTLVSPNDVNSFGSPTVVSSTNDMHFIYNETNNPKYFRVTPGGASSKTLGTTDVLAQTSASNNRRAVVVTFPESGTIESISLCHAGGTGGVIMGIYADDGGVPGELLGTTGIVAVNAVSGWQTEQLVSPINVTQGQSVWIAWIFQNNVGMRYVGGSPDRAQAPAVWSEGLPNPFGTASMAAYRYSAYCTYSAVSSGSVVDVTGQSYSGVIELDPWTALVLLGGATVSEITGPSIEGRFYRNDDGVLLRSDGDTLLKIE
ncbi:MAG: right-handed parallel beta-helix repeat-containing protein [Flavobacteriaceae bacterium]